MANLSKTTNDHEEIRKWAEERGGKPSHVKSTGSSDEFGILRIDFPGFSGEGSLEEITWDQFFEKFDEQGLSLIYQEETAGGERSNFNKLVSAETAHESDGAGRDNHAGPSVSKKSPAGKKSSSAKKTATAKKASKAPGKSSSKSSGAKKATPTKGASKKAAAKNSTAVKKGANKKAASKKAPLKKAVAKKAGKKVSFKKAASKKASAKKAVKKRR